MTTSAPRATSARDGSRRAAKTSSASGPNAAVYCGKPSAFRQPSRCAASTSTTRASQLWRRYPLRSCPQDLLAKSGGTFKKGGLASGQQELLKPFIIRKSLFLSDLREKRQEMRMEPGGIEPPSRDSQLAASTRLVGDLFSAPRRPPTACVMPSPSYVLPLAAQASARG